MATEKQRSSYEEVNGPVPKGPLVDSDGLVQQTSEPAPAPSSKEKLQVIHQAMRLQGGPPPELSHMIITARIWTGKLYKLQAELKSTLAGLREDIQRKLAQDGIGNVSAVKLIYKGLTLEENKDARSLVDCGVRSGSLVHVFPTNVKEFEFTTSNLAGTKMKLKCPENATVGLMKDSIARQVYSFLDFLRSQAISASCSHMNFFKMQLEADKNKVELYVSSKRLENDTKTLQNIEFKNDTEIKVIVNKVPTFDVQVKTLTGKSFTISLPMDSNTTTLKKKLHEKTGISETQQRLVYAGKQLEDSRNLKDYNMILPPPAVPDSLASIAPSPPTIKQVVKPTVHMVLRLRGPEISNFTAVDT